MEILISADNPNNVSISDGMNFVIWWWKGADNAELNEQFIATKPIWEIFSPKETFLLMVGDGIRIDKEIIDKNFDKYNKYSNLFKYK
jgi:hypothetical protein